MPRVPKVSPLTDPAPVEDAISLMSEVFALVGSTKDSQQMLKGACRLLTAGRPWELAWVGIVDPNGRIQPIAQAGLRDKDLGSISLAWDSDSSGEAIAPTAARESLPQVMTDLKEDRRPEPWRTQALARGCRAAAAFPLRFGENVLGVLSLYAPSSDAFGTAELSVLQGLTDHLAHGLGRLQAEEQRAKRMREFEVIRSLTSEMISRPDHSTLLHTVVEKATDLLEGACGGMYLSEPEEQVVRCLVSYPTPPDYTGAVLRYGEGAAGLVAQTGQGMIIPDYPQWPGRSDLLQEGAPLQSLLTVPMTLQGRVIGVIEIWRTAEQPPFTRADLDLLTLFANQAAVALENARLIEWTASERQRVQLLYDVTQALTRSLDPAEILQRAIALTTDSIGAMFGEAFLLERSTGRLRLRVLAGRDPVEIPEIESRLSARQGKGLVGWIAKTRQPALVDDVTTDDRWEEVGGVEGIHTALGAPVLAGNDLLGVIMLFHRDRAAFHDEHLHLLTAIARQVGLALSNAERFQQTRRRLAEMSAIQQVGQVINRRLEMQPLLEEVVHQVGEVLGYPVVEILLVDGQELTVRASRGSKYEVPHRIPLSEGLVGRAARTNEPAYAPDIRLDPDYVNALPDTQAEIVVPLRERGVVFGVMNVESPEAGSLTEDDLRLLSLLADQISVAIENAALYDHLRQHADELEQTVAERTSLLAEALEQARQADRIKSQFVSDVSHELRTPLSNIRLYLDLLTQGKPDRFSNYVDTLTRETERLMRLIEDLLAISRLDAGATPLTSTPLDLNDLARTLVQDRQRLFAARGLVLQFQPQAALPPILADEHMLSQVVANLLTNAMQYTPMGTVTISTASMCQDDRTWTTLTVADTGLGIPLEEQPRLFERFFRGANSHTVRAPGTGLGLAICKEILDRHGGKISLESQVGRGSAFTLWLPACEGPPVAPSAHDGIEG